MRSVSCASLLLVLTDLVADFTPWNYTACALLYSVFSDEYSACARFELAYQQPLPDNWGIVFREHFLPLLNLVSGFRPGCALPTHDCIVVSSFQGSSIGTSLAGSLFVPGPDESLPPLTFTVPEYSVRPLRLLSQYLLSQQALPAFSVQTMPICSGLFPPSPLLSSLFLFYINMVIMSKRREEVLVTELEGDPDPQVYTSSEYGGPRLMHWPSVIVAAARDVGLMKAVTLQRAAHLELSAWQVGQ